MEPDLTPFDKARRPTGRRCEWSGALATLELGQRESVEAAFDAGYPYTAIVEVVAGWTGRRFDPGVAGRHRRDECVSCREARDART